MWERERFEISMKYIHKIYRADEMRREEEMRGDEMR
tara:strand:+ start:346 stop:453 length:108 start_codon:yes stop_codon:yes gene_type:complete